MRKTLTVKPKVSNILDVLEDDTSFKLGHAPDIQIGMGREPKSNDESIRISRSESLCSEGPSRNTSRRSSVSISCGQNDITARSNLSRSTSMSSLSSLVTNANFHVKKGISTSTKLSRG